MMKPPQIDNFEIIGLLGQGGMSTVWKARQRSLDRDVAIKVLAANFASDPNDIDRFREEARVAAKLAHPGVVRVFDANFQNGSYYFVMELIDGYTIGQWLRRKGCLPIDDALVIAEYVAEALDYGWTKFHMVHCDIKPDNIMVDADGTVKVADLGLARSISAVQMGETDDEIMGTPVYMSPEQINGQVDLDCRADIYSLGAMLYHLISGRMLFAGTPDQIMDLQVTGQAPALREVQPKATLACELLIEKMLAKNRVHRPYDWKEVIRDIQRVRRKHPPVGVMLPSGASTMRHDPEIPQFSPEMPTPLSTRPYIYWWWLILTVIIIMIIAVASGWWLCPSA